MLKKTLTLVAVAVGLALTPAAAQADYLHLDECRGALLGANGDNDIKRHADWRGVTFKGWGDYYRVSSHEIRQQAVFYTDSPNVFYTRWFKCWHPYPPNPTIWDDII